MTHDCLSGQSLYDSCKRTCQDAGTVHIELSGADGGGADRMYSDDRTVCDLPETVYRRDRNFRGKIINVKRIGNEALSGK